MGKRWIKVKDNNTDYYALTKPNLITPFQTINHSSNNSCLLDKTCNSQSHLVSNIASGLTNSLYTKIKNKNKQQFFKSCHQVLSLTSLELQTLPFALNSRTNLGGSEPVTDTAQQPFTFLSILCHLATQLSSGVIKAINPSKLALVHSITTSLLFFMCRNSSQFSHPSNSN